MNILLWVLQVLLAVHTFMGAVWKSGHSERSVPSLKAIPHGGWLALIVVELLCVAGLLVPALKKSLGVLAPISALVVAAEMLLFCGVALASGGAQKSELTYWLVVAAIGAFIAVGRFVLKPF